jgi:hypothetical protein
LFVPTASLTPLTPVPTKFTTKLRKLRLPDCVHRTASLATKLRKLCLDPLRSGEARSCGSCVSAPRSSGGRTWGQTQLPQLLARHSDWGHTIFSPDARTWHQTQLPQLLTRHSDWGIRNLPKQPWPLEVGSCVWRDEVRSGGSCVCPHFVPDSTLVPTKFTTKLRSCVCPTASTALRPFATKLWKLCLTPPRVSHRVSPGVPTKFEVVEVVSPHEVRSRREVVSDPRRRCGSCDGQST